MPDVTIAEVRQAFRDADVFATEVAEFRRDAVIPALNQMRNAGHHFVHAIGDDGSIKSTSDLYDARDHCRRAMYDAAVAGILSARDYITDFREQYKGVVVSEVVPTFSEIVVRSTKARDLIAEGRYDAKSDDERVQGYLQMFRSLRDDVDLLAASEDDLNVKKLGIQRDWQRGKIGVIASVSIAVGSLIGALISGLAVYWSIMSPTCP